MRISHIFMAMFLAAIPSYGNAAEPITGYRDLKFGMNQDAVSSVLKSACKHYNKGFGHGVGCYEVGGIKRDLRVWFDPPASSKGLLKSIVIEFGIYDEKQHREIYAALEKKHDLVYIFDETDIAAFNTGQSNVLLVIFGEGHIVLKIARVSAEVVTFRYETTLTYVYEKEAKELVEKFGSSEEFDEEDF